MATNTQEVNALGSRQTYSNGDTLSDREPTTGGYLAGKTRIRVSDLKEAKLRGEKWSMLTCYDAISAQIFDKAKIPCLLVGDSAAQMVYGYKSTIPVSMEELIPLARAVASSCERAFVIGDLPFGSYQGSPKMALENAVRLMKEAQVHGVKLEGGREYVEHVKLLTQSGIPVMAHIGFTPQSEHALGGFKIQGRDSEALAKLCEDSRALEMAGAFACVLELMPSAAGKLVTERLSIPTVGIGAGPHCDAQVLVWHDMAGFLAPKGGRGVAYLSSNSIGDQSCPAEEKRTSCLELRKAPKFAKRYANLSEILYKAATDYANDVALGKYPSKEHCYD